MRTVKPLPKLDLLRARLAVSEDGVLTWREGQFAGQQAGAPKDKANNRPDNLQLLTNADNLKKAHASSAWNLPRS